MNLQKTIFKSLFLFAFVCVIAIGTPPSTACAQGGGAIPFREATPQEIADFWEGTQNLIDAIFNGGGGGGPGGPGDVVPNPPNGGGGLGGGGVLIAETGLIGVLIVGLGYEFIDLTYELYENETGDWDGDGIPNIDESGPDVIYQPTDLIDAGINVLINSGPNGHPDEAWDSFGVHLAGTLSTVIVWWNSD